ncbi:putative 2OG-Fe(II) oxygenase [Actinomadura decatromicini]|uniref:Uncharacterized protein n=1 Tax=Actinomadura decatromicini TaxID=2604572 RepID=A0A5D3F651_9ACTN|nr:putative 2OG-Fe(II) oxygenase [Actinomadura decatromicini]TYK44497.1 hypothetical protein FXF68_34065 [Actinomadura decatromicini]
MTDTDIAGTALAAPADRLVLEMWRTPVYQADCAGAAEHLPALRRLVLDAARARGPAGLEPGVIEATRTMLTWDDPAIDWLRRQIGIAGEALARAVLGDAAGEAGEHDIEAWAVVHRSGAAPRPHARRDSAWSGVLSLDGGDGDAAHLRLLDPRPAAADRPASPGVVRHSPVPGRMIAFPSWQAPRMEAAATGSRTRIAVAWNISYVRDRAS